MRLFLSLLMAMPALAFAGQIKVLDRDGRGIAGARIIFGDETLSLSADLITDTDGNFQIPVDWKTLSDVTIMAPGYIPTTFVKLEPTDTTLQINSIDSRQFYQISGQTVDFQGVKKDGKVDFGLTYPAMNKRDVINFDLTSIVSPESDQIDIVTDKFDIPSNLTLPNQTETYLLPINLNKPNFRMFIRRPGTYQVMATQGRFPLARVINDLQNGKSIFQVLNNFDFVNAGQMTVDVNSNMDVGNISVKQITYNSTVSIQGPTIPAHYGIFTAALVEQNGLLYPSDLKSLVPGQVTNLKVPQASGTNYLISLMTEEPKNAKDQDGHAELTPQDFSPAAGLLGSITKLLTALGFYQGPGPDETKLPTGMSLAFQPAKGQVTPEFLDMIPVPQVVSETQLSARAPTTKSTIIPVATYVVLSEIEVPQGGSTLKIEKRFRTWESYIQGWTGNISLPRLKLSTDKSKKYRWEVYYLGRRTDFSETPTYFLDGITHVTRNSVDLN